MSNKDYTRKNAAWTLTKPSRDMSRDFYEGDEAVKLGETGEKYLLQNPTETDDQYELRLARSAIEPFVPKIIDARQSLLFRQKIVRELPPKIGAHIDNVDLKGSTADTFFEDVARDAQIDGISWVLVDMPTARTDAEGNPLPVETARDVLDQGLRPFFSKVSARAVIDWKVGDNKRLEWAVVEGIEVITHKPGEEPETITTFTVWYPDRFEVFIENGSDIQLDIERSGPHDAGEVPLVPFLGQRLSDYSGYSIARPVLPFIKQIYNKTSDMDHFEWLAAHPILTILSPTEPAQLDTGQGIWIKTQAAGPKTEVSFTEASGSSFASLRESIDDKKKMIFSVSLASAKDESAQVQSADGQREDRKIFSSSLRTSSESYEAAERRCWVMAANMTSTDIATIEIQWPRDFDDKSIEAAMLTVFKELAFLNILPEGELLRIMIEGGILKTDKTIEELLKEAKESTLSDDQGISASAAQLAALDASERE